MSTVYIVTKRSPAEVTEEGHTLTVDFSTNEAVFSTRNAAKEYVSNRKAVEDRDDDGCQFVVEPWWVQ